MQNTKENRFFQLLDYFKITFKMFWSRKKIYLPIIVYHAIMFVFLAAFLLSMIKPFIEVINMANNAGDFLTVIKPFIGLPLLTAFPLFLLALLGPTLLDAILYTIYRSYLGDSITSPKKNIVRVFLEFLLANIIILLFWILAFIPYMIVGTLTLLIGFSLIPFLVNVLLLFYKSVYITTDKNILQSMKESINFAYENIVIALLLQISMMLFSLNYLSGSAGARMNGNLNSLPDMANKISPPGSMSVDNGFVILVAIIVLIILLVASIAAIIKHILLSYFQFTATYIYNDIKDKNVKEETATYKSYENLFTTEVNNEVV